MKKIVVLLVLPIMFFVGLLSVNAAKITYHANGGAISQGSNPDEYSINAPDGLNFNVEAGATVTGPTGYAFVGWYNHEQWTSGDHITNVVLNPNQHLNLWARYELEDYKLEYDLDGGTVEGTNPETYHYKDNPTLIINPTKEGYEFVGWTGPDHNEPTTQLAIRDTWTGDRKYTANWKPIEYTIDYDLDGGEVSTANPETYNIETDDFVLNNPEKEGHEFIGWEQNGSNVGDNVTVYKGTKGNLAFKALFEIKRYVLTFDTDGGSSIDDLEVDYGTVVDLTKYTPTKEGYKFVAWMDEDGGEIIDIAIYEDTTVTAKWEKIEEAKGTTAPENIVPSSNVPNTDDDVVLYFALLIISSVGLLSFKKFYKLTA